MNTRGIRNNNPANIRIGCKWKGLVENPTDKEFCQFITMTWGVRALLVTLRTYVVKHKMHTIRDIIYRWAPPSDGNNTEKYVEFVKKAIREINSPITQSLQPFNFMPKYQHSECILFLVAKAMCKMESGYDLDYGIYLSALHLM